MERYVEVTFQRMPRDPSVETAAHRWVARLESANIAVRYAAIFIEQSDRRHISVWVTLHLGDGARSTTTASREDAYVAVGDAFRAARREQLERTTTGARARVAYSFAG